MSPVSEHHHHDHDDGVHIDWAVMGPVLEQGAEVQTPLLRQAADWLRELLTATDGTDRSPDTDANGGEGENKGTDKGTDEDAVRRVRRVLDVGSGPGVMTCLLAEVFPDAEIVAVDPTEALLERARDRAARLGLADRVRTLRAELPHTAQELRTATGLGIGEADLIWSSKALHHVGDQRAAVAALARHLRPHGLLAAAEGGLERRVLPRDFGIGRPGLQARLDAAHEDAFTRIRAALPGVTGTVEDWPSFLTDAGLHTPRTRSFLLDLPAPLSTAAREHIIAQLSHLAGLCGEHLDEEDRATLARLVDPDDEAGIARRPDVFLLSAQTVHTARAA
ncbi:class I SAM-dependent methyltransferase [Streptomyces sp. MST-110588]|uniref:class I SAM-dependent methyltransferase n=1 Tax=Streptomyces sp. MST-110588 TaxID=2833628 RepID=UPI001F5D1181|nr:class I SAM-dependent methyltransferase [Streptomyces sp. MST-110588]UNO39210.1 methyltransferase domain-containing protein [Streptomyces sp. MST-110588]